VFHLCAWRDGWSVPCWSRRLCSSVAYDDALNGNGLLFLGFVQCVLKSFDIARLAFQKHFKQVSPIVTSLQMLDEVKDMVQILLFHYCWIAAVMLRSNLGALRVGGCGVAHFEIVGFNAWIWLPWCTLNTSCDIILKIVSFSVLVLTKSCRGS
jgi:hypothetical protein